jgi:hypothetical protein
MKRVTVTLGIDWELLRTQKEYLLGLKNDQAEGICGLIDHIQDTAVDTKQATSEEVFGPAVEEEG